MERPAHRGLRHLALNVRDLEAMKRFYCDLLGFAVEWEPDPDNVYLSSGIDNLALHRSTALTTGRPAALATGPSAALTTSGSTPGPAVAAGNPASGAPAQTLDHLGLIVRDMAEVDRWAEFLEEHGVRLAARPRTHRDGARSCYFHDPDGNRVQIIFHPPISQKI